jgi:hypothetical protein
MATTTPNFGWPVPTSSDLVKNGATAIEGLGDAIDASLLDLKGGTTDQVLAKNSNTDMDFKWVSDATGMTNPMTTTGDVIYSSSGSTPARLGIGTAGQVLKVNSGATAPEWATPAAAGTGPAFRAFRNSSNQSIASTTAVKVQLNAETFDTDGCFDPTTNYRFTPTTAGYYLITANISLISGGAGYGTAFIYLNGSRVSAGRVPIWDTGSKNPQVSDIIYLNGSSDYIELYTLNNGATASVEAGTDETWLTGAFIHS